MALAGIGILSIALFLGKGFIGGGETDAQEMMPMLVADRYIAAFSVLKKEDVTLKHIPKAYVPPGMLYTWHELLNDQDQPLYTTAVAIPAGQPITRSLLLESAKSQGLARLLSPGQMALSIVLDAVHGMGGWLQPGDTVALYQGNTSVPRAEQKVPPVSRLLFSNLTVLAVNKHRLGTPDAADPSEEKQILDDLSRESASLVTLRVNPVQAAVIIQAREQGPLTAVLRAPGDTDL